MMGPAYSDLFAVCSHLWAGSHGTSMSTTNRGSRATPLTAEDLLSGVSRA